MPYDFNPLIDLYGQTVAQELPPEALSEAERLKQQQMERGLAPAAPGAANPLTYSGPVAGYSGPVRPSDAPEGDAFSSVPVYYGSKLSPQSQEGRIRNTGFGDTTLGRAIDLLGGLKGAGVKGGEAILEQIAPGVMTKLSDRDRRTKLEDYQDRRRIARDEATAPGGTYLDESGVPYSPQTGAEIQPKSTFYRKGSPEEKTFDASHMINTHVDRTMDVLGSIAQGDRNRFSQYLNTSLKRLKNNPEVNTLIDLLGPATALAVSSAYAASGNSMRGGVRLADMFKNGVYGEGDTLRTSLTKMRNLEQINLDNVKNRNLHPTVIKEAQDRIAKIDALLKGEAPGQAAATPQGQAPGGAPQPGTVVKGYRFKGGDPSKQENWEAVQQ